MKKQLLSAALVAVFSGALAINANAATNGKITFQGKVVEQTCQINDNDQNQIVKLNPVARNVFTNKADVAMPTPFSIVLKDCTTGTRTHAKKVKAGFSSVANVDATNAYTLKNKTASNYASNVHIQLFNKNGTSAISPMKYSNAANNTTNPATVTHSLDDNGEFKEIGTTSTPALQYIAKYYATTNGGVTAGEVETSVDFELVYE
ncbi:fimbrial protein [Haemophilus influenzae]|uniref:fimbrial protein n=1 Tax=Haemophilus influenzae TaxID=727 RepID=UPI0001F37155|nr:fimbrial protein [Haemophilus influenzae]CBY80514.1 putative fimbrial protein [Haemophilus influenzae F3031]